MSSKRLKTWGNSRNLEVAIFNCGGQEPMVFGNIKLGEIKQSFEQALVSARAGVFHGEIQRGVLAEQLDSELDV